MSMSPLAEAAMHNASIRYQAAQKRGKRKAKAARAIQEEPEGTRHKKDPWNDVHKFKDMRLHLCDSARETIRRLRNG